MRNAAIRTLSEKEYQNDFPFASGKIHETQVGNEDLSPFRQFLSWDECPRVSPGEDLLEEARAVTEKLIAGDLTTAVAARHENMTQFAIGHLIANILKKRQTGADFREIGAIYEAITPGIRRAAERHAAGTGAQVGRTAVIDELRKKGILEDVTQIRQLKPAGTTPSIRDIGVVLEDTTGLPLEQIVSSSRERTIVAARFRAIWIMRHVCGHPLSVIGRNVGGRDHTTVLNSLNKVAIEQDGDIGKRIHMAWLCERSDAMGIRSNYAILRHQETARVNGRYQDQA